ncbi:MAG: hypothetical protein QM736_26410 [Vicinamibacterales bacterium]
MGEPVGPRHDGPWPARATVDAALERFRGTFLQQPPAFSAKKIAGQRSYALARAGRTSNRNEHREIHADVEEETVRRPLPEPVTVTAYAVDLKGVDDDVVRLHVRCSAGFYIRSLAYDLGVALGTGAHLVELRRTDAAGSGLSEAIPLERIEGEPGRETAESRIVPIARCCRRCPPCGSPMKGCRT